MKVQLYNAPFMLVEISQIWYIPLNVTHLSGGFQRLKTKCRNWVCGIDEDAKQNMTAQELQALRRKMTSLEEDSKLKTILNASAIFISLVTVFLLGYFH